MRLSPAVILYDSEGKPLAVQDGDPIPAGTPGLLISGTDGVNARVLKTDADGTVSVDGSAVTQPVSAASLPLPTGAATETTLSALEGKTPSLVGGRMPVDGSGVTQPVSGTVAVSNFPATQPVSAVSLPLPTGAATETTLSSINSKLPTLGQKVMTGSVPVVLPSNQDVSVNITSRNNIDAFQRFRTAAPTALFDSKLLNDNAPLFWDDQQTSGGGTSSTYNTNQASVTLAVGASTAGKRIRQTFRCFQYQPGISQFIAMTGIIGTPATGITREIGFGNDNNGYFFRSSPTAVNVVLRTFTSGAPTETVVPQSSWNLDKMDGTGATGINLDFSKTQIFVTMFQWLGVGSVWYGVDVSGTLYWVHRIDNANSLSVVYLSNPNLPLRYSIQNDGTGAAANLTAICSVVVAEGGVHPTGRNNGIVRDTLFATGNDARLYPVMALRYKVGYGCVGIELKHLNIVCTTSAPYSWRLLLNPTVAGTAFTFTDITNSALQATIATTNATTVTGGTLIDCGIAQQSSDSVQIDITPTKQNLGVNIAGTSDVLVLAVQRLSTQAESFHAAITWSEQN